MEDVEKIVQAKHEWQISVDALPLIVCLIDETGRVIRTNRALESWRLGTVESVRGTPANVLLHPVCAAPDCQVRERRRMVHGGSSGNLFFNATRLAMSLPEPGHAVGLAAGLSLLFGLQLLRRRI